VTQKQRQPPSSGLLRKIGAYAGADKVMEENQTSGGLPLVTWGECSFFRLHPLFAGRAAG
jgi:hypothetical protein